MPLKKVVMIIASKNFRDEEYFEPKKILTDAGISVTTASSTKEKATGMLGGSVQPDILITDIKIDNYDAIIFIGGSGSNEYWYNKIAHKILTDSVSKNKIIGAICIAPVTLANADILKDKKATVFVSEKAKLISKGAKYTGGGVQQDGLIVTASGPKYAIQFGMKIKQMLKK